MNDKVNCAIWGTPAKFLPTDRDGDTINSSRAGGSYFITGSARADTTLNDDGFKAKLTTWLVDQRNLGIDTPEISSYTLDTVSGRRSLEAYERADRLLTLLNRCTEFLGEAVPFAEGEGISNEMLAWSESAEIDELYFLLGYLERSGWIELCGKMNGGEATVTMAGYDRLRELERTRVDSTQAFVAMWFDPSMDDAYQQGIESGIKSAGYKPVRIDRRDHNNKIDDEIIAEIRRSRFVVADFTQSDTEGARGGVYYEAGFAHGLGVPVIFSCRKDALPKVHFDTRQYNHIVWQTPEELRDRLSLRISATIGDGPLK